MLLADSRRSELVGDSTSDALRDGAHRRETLALLS